MCIRDRYKPITESVHERPLLVVPPQINKFYVFDLSPDKSLARFLLRSQVPVYYTQLDVDKRQAQK